MPDRTAHYVRDAIEREIVEGAQTPGSRLDEASLAARFNVSRTPVREALLGLESSGLVELRPRRGAFVRQVSARELIEMFETMAELEAVCARLAAARISPEQERALQTRLEECETAAAAADIDRYYKTNERFHAAIYASVNNQFLEQQALALQARLKPYRRHQLKARGRLAQSMAEHRAGVAAILSADEATAAATLRAHVVIQGEKFATLMAALEPPRRRAVGA